jgi:hypothetical protein
MIYAFVSFITGVSVFYLGMQLANLKLWTNYSFSYLLWDYGLLFLLEILILVFIWWISGLISSRKYLK